MASADGAARDFARNPESQTPQIPPTQPAANASHSAPAQAQAEPTWRTAVTYREQRLPIQPVITAHPTLVEDLAASVPSAPVSGPAVPHAPVKSGGLWGALTIGIGATLVHRVMLDSGSGLFHAASAGAALLYVDVLVLAPVAFLCGFGMWLRRSGYVTAARSDIVARSYIFAFPGLMGYVTVLPNMHNPFLVVSDGERREKFGCLESLGLRARYKANLIGGS
jgi:hypothetical protein